MQNGAAALTMRIIGMKLPRSRLWWRRLVAAVWHEEMKGVGDDAQLKLEPDCTSLLKRCPGGAGRLGAWKQSFVSLANLQEFVYV